MDVWILAKTKNFGNILDKISSAKGNGKYL